MPTAKQLRTYYVYQGPKTNAKTKKVEPKGVWIARLDLLKQELGEWE